MTDNMALASLDRKQLDFSGRDYNHVALTAVLESINLVSNTSKFVHDIISSNNNGDKLALKLSFGRDLLDCAFDAESGLVSAVFRYNVRGRRNGQNCFSIKADYAVLYSIPHDSNPDAAAAFVQNVGVFAAYAYFRAFVAQVVWNAGLNIPPLPTIASQAWRPRPD